MLDSEVIKKYADKPVKNLKALAQRHFNKFIRKRDKGQPCISCGQFRKLQAGHFYSVGKYSSIRYEEDNVNGQCQPCNYYGSMETGSSYRLNLHKKIGEEKLINLDQKAAHYKRHGHRWDRFSLIEIIEKYKKLNKAG